MRIDPCRECGEYVDIASDHAAGCSRRSGRGAAGTAAALSVEAQPVLVDTQAAAAAVHVAAVTVRSWQHRGWLVRKGTGRRNRALWDLADVYALAAALRVWRESGTQEPFAGVGER
ncbi:helix-turn-helix DNA-binding domain protein [Arthrobacter phage LittleTokyo]|nr:helix-turn-helix DNA-binding domain protein [Arthrobacter phage LittleTokyo]